MKFNKAKWEGAPGFSIGIFAKPDSFPVIIWILWQTILSFDFNY